MPDLDIAEHFRPCPDQNAAPDFRVPVARLLARPAERHILKDRDIILNHRRLPDNQSRRMIKKHALPDPRFGIDIRLEHFRRAALQVERKVRPPLLPERVCHSVRLERMKALETVSYTHLTLPTKA